MKKLPSKVAHNRPRFFFQYWPGCPKKLKSCRTKSTFKIQDWECTFVLTIYLWNIYFAILWKWIKNLVKSQKQTNNNVHSEIFDPIVNHYTTSKDVKCRFMSTQSARCVMCFASLSNRFIGLIQTHGNLKFSVIIGWHMIRMSEFCSIV